METAKYQNLPAADDGDHNGDECVDLERRTDRALAAAYLLTTFSIFLSLFLVVRWPPESIEPTAGVLYRPNPYIGLERILFPANTTFPPIVTYPRAIFQISNGDAARILKEGDRQWASKFGSVVPEEYRFVATSTESSIVQFHAMDWGMEHCVLHLRIPSTISIGSFAMSLDIWRLDDDKELARHISWKQAPRRQEPGMPQHFVAGQKTSAIEFTCPSGSFPTFEFRCSKYDPACVVDFWQNMARSAETGVYIVQHWSKS